MIQEIPRRSETEDEEKVIHLNYGESAELTAMTEKEPEDPTGEAYLQWIREQSEKARSKRLQPA
jgi:hypothetical protein